MNILKRLPSVCHFVMAVAFVACVGCSVKEDRSECPCIVVLDLSGVDDGRFRSLTVRAESSDGFLLHEIVSGNPLPDKFMVKMPRGEIRMNIICEDGNEVMTGSFNDSGVYRIPENSECPPVYFTVGRLNTDTDMVEVPVDPKKNYCRVFIEMLSTGPYIGGLNIIGNVCGYDIEGRPMHGDFRFASGLEEGGVCEVNVPRQSDTSLRLQIIDGSGILKDFALGEYIAASGYDWNAEELDDIGVAIDYSRTKITFKVRDWEKIFEFDVVI